ncbi:MAG TPA: porin [Vicinamibacterales bacterium]|nr:porin [Vicinamibacterales bacterium]
MPPTYGFFYKEITREGRIYVFNNPEEAARFEASGELGRAITKPGTGPNGETVIGDSERALQLFYFKHGLSEPVPDPEPLLQRIEWRDGKTRISTSIAYLEISNRVQFRYTHDFPPDNVTRPGTENPGDSIGSFRIRRAKTKFEGWFWKAPQVAPLPVTMPRYSYEMQMNWPGASVANPAALLEDATFMFDPTEAGVFRVVVGQFKVPQGRQEMTSSGSQQFVDRTLVSNEFARGRDIGIAVQGATRGNKLEYRFGIFNGNGVSQSIDNNAAKQVNLRLMWQPNGSQVLAQRAWISGALYSEADFESTTAPIYAVAFTYERNDFHRTTTGNDTKSNVIGLDGIYKYKGFSTLGEYYFRKRTPETGSKFDSNGGFFQAGMMLNRYRTWEAAFRYGQRDINDTVDNDDITEIRGALSYYYKRHALKFQMDFGQLKTELPAGGSQKAKELRLQAQFIF